ncbi:MAG: chemotaxis protein [Campylobacteraceae bacterium]|nr:chemotaxis protein [Campylobacteraceae bacterium]
MTQEELDALMAGGLDNIEEDDSIEEKQESEDSSENEYIQGYRVSSEMSWPPPPPTNDHKVVHQLDDVTRDSEIKATEVFDKLEAINESMVSIEEEVTLAMKTLENNTQLFSLLIDKFPGVERFKEALDDNETAKEKLENVISSAQSAEDDIMMTMDIMQYQDINRQKIERVINVMRALSQYMNDLFEGQIEDSKRVSSAVHIQGDDTTRDVVTNEDIEALIYSLGKK